MAAVAPLRAPVVPAARGAAAAPPPGRAGPVAVAVEGVLVPSRRGKNKLEVLGFIRWSFMECC